MRESRTQSEIMIALGGDPRVLISRRNVGRFLAVSGKLQRAIDVLKSAGIFATVIAIGTKGEADLQGIVSGQTCKICGADVHPAPFAIEVKSDDGERSPEQVRWARETWQRRGGIYVLARNVAEARGALFGGSDD